MKLSIGKIQKMALLTAFACLCVGPVRADASVDFLGETTLSFGTDIDVIHAGPCPSAVNKPVAALKLAVSHRGAEIDFVGVEYGNGATERLYVRENFREGSESRWIDLNGGKRCVTKIWIVGDTNSFLPIGQRAKIKVYGAR